MAEIRESDWKQFRRLQPLAIDRFCRRVLSDLQATASDEAMTAHEQYLKVYRLIHDQDTQMAKIFNDIRRSNAVVRGLLA